MEEEPFPININKPIIEVKHKDLKRDSKNSIYKSVCPVCGIGVLLMSRDQETLKLLEYDCCISCGQRFKYTDLPLIFPKEVLWKY